VSKVRGTASLESAAVKEILDGVFHCSVFHEPIQGQVSSYYVEPAGIVIDPKSAWRPLRTGS
jgi:hypothetical protein